MSALAMVVSKQIEQQRTMAALNERTRIEQQIQTSLADSLTALTMQLETTQTYLQEGRTAQAEEMLAAAREMARTALQDTRRAVRNLGSSTGPRLSLRQILEQMLKDVQKETGVLTRLQIGGEEYALTEEQVRILENVALEALKNAQKHASPTHIRVGLQFGRQEIALLVEDDGTGFDLQQVQQQENEASMGLIGMNERVHLGGGMLVIDSTPGWGTRIRAALPLQDDGPPPASLPPAAYLPAAQQHAPALRVLIADEIAMMRQGLRSMLEPEPSVQIVAEVENGNEAVEQALALQPDIVLLDTHMPGLDGIEALRRIHAANPAIQVVMLAASCEEQQAAEALQAGARGVLLKDMSAHELAAALKSVHQGEIALAHEISRRLVLAAGHAAQASSAHFGLNDREMEVLQLLARGARNKEIAAALYIAPKTVEYHLSNIFAKLGVSNRTEAARKALELRIVPPGSLK